MSIKFTPKIGLAEFYNAAMKARGFELAPHHMTICTALEDHRIQSLMVITGPGNGKSTVTSTVYPAWVLGHAPESTILGVGSAEHLMQQFSKGTAEIIADNPVFKHLFPNVRPDKQHGWSPQGGYNVKGRPPGDPDASYLGVGINSKALTGKHGRIILLDDLHDRDNGMTIDGCLKVRDTYYAQLLGRADARGARFVLSGRRWNTEDIYGHFLESGDWVTMTLPAERPDQKLLWWDVNVPKDRRTGKPMPCVFSEKLEPLPEVRQDADKPYIRYRALYGYDPSGAGFYWPNNEAKRKEYFTAKRNQPATAEATYQCNPSYRENAVFEDSDFCFDHMLNGANLDQGIADKHVSDVIHDYGSMVVQSWDTGFGKSADSAYSVCVTALLVPFQQYWRGEDPFVVGECDRHMRVYILDVFRKKLDFAQLNSAFREQYRKWEASLVLIENRASGISLVQTLRTSGIPIRPVEAKEGKIQRAVGAVGGAAGSVQGWFRQHRVVLPRKAEWLSAFVGELKAFSGQESQKKDQVDATVYLVAHAISVSVGQVRIPSDIVMNELEQLAVMGAQAGMANNFAIGYAMNVDQLDPFMSTCARCGNWEGNVWQNGVHNPHARPFCGLHQRPTAAIDSCLQWEEPAGALHQSSIVLR